MRLKNHPLILSVETATLGGSVCLAREGAVVSYSVGEPRISHSNTLLRDIDKVLANGQTTLGEIDLFAVASGPGSFTGLRIGVATIKALAATLERPCSGIPSLHAVAHAGGESERTVALLPAGRGEVFAQMFSVSPQGHVTELDAIAHVAPVAMLEKYAAIPDIRWCGEGAHMYADSIAQGAAREGHQLVNSAGELMLGARPAWRLASREPNLAPHVAALALMRFEQNQLDTPSSLRAIYVRPSDAELNESCPPLSHQSAPF